MTLQLISMQQLSLYFGRYLSTLSLVEVCQKTLALYKGETWLVKTIEETFKKILVLEKIMYINFVMCYYRCV